MKIILTSILFLLISSSHLYSQGIYRDEVDVLGKRTIITDEGSFANNQSVGISYIINSVDTTIFLNFTLEDRGILEEGRKLLIKFKDDSILELENIIGQTARILPGRIGMLGGPVWGLRPRYVLTQKQLDELCTKEVVKLRFEQNDDVLDYKIRRNKFTKILHKCREAILHADEARKEIYNNF